MKKILEITLKNETPLFLGSYDAQFHPEDAFRAQSLKGLWRWWTRAYIAGALFEKNRLDFDILGKLVSNILGGTENCSKLRIACSYEIRSEERPVRRVSIENREIRILANNEEINDDYIRYNGIEAQRVRLLARGREISYIVADNLSVTVELWEYRELGVNELNLCVGSLLSALILDGLGKMSRRGYGTFRIDSVKQFKNIDIIDKIFIVNNQIDICKLVKETLDRAHRYIEEKGIREKRERGGAKLPKIDLVTGKFLENRIPIFSIYEVKGINWRSNELLLALHNFFARPFRSSKGDVCQDHGIAVTWCDDIRREKVAWFLGLPRHQKSRNVILKANETLIINKPETIDVMISFEEGSTKDVTIISVYGNYRRHINISNRSIIIRRPITRVEIRAKHGVRRLRLQIKTRSNIILRDYDNITGYLSESTRRASPIHLSAHRDRVYISIFLSEDWPSKVEWFGTHYDDKHMPKLYTICHDVFSIDFNRIIKAYNTVLQELKQYIQNRRDLSIRQLFPCSDAE
ncbi:MAG: type III-B CRISPR module RAMP protein Cmr1 [Crenarchaeota archaeon]|nr:type III-B CRISPR module RAMP protein Cmr1 [Thermoproteota archaeon]